MGYAIVMGYCIACRNPIQFNPHKVPSIRHNGVREPLCCRCADRWNELHPQNAQEIPADAYEPISEEEL